MKKYFRWIGYLEGTSLLVLLFIAMPIKYIFHHPEAVRAVGSIHGFLFISYIALATMLAGEERWGFKKWFTAFILSCLPTGTFIFDRKYMA